MHQVAAASAAQEQALEARSGQVAAALSDLLAQLAALPAADRAASGQASEGAGGGSLLEGGQRLAASLAQLQQLVAAGAAPGTSQVELQAMLEVRGGGAAAWGWRRAWGERGSQVVCRQR